MMPSAPVAAALVAFAAYVVVQRFAELAISARNGRRLAAQGACFRSDDGFRFIVVLHVLFPLALIAEVTLLGARPGPAWPGWLGLWLGAQVLRLAAVRALGPRWHVRVVTLPGVAPVRHGPYRLLRHPNYVAVVVEFVASAMLFGAWRTMIAISLLNAVALARRIRVENEAVYG